MITLTLPTTTKAAVASRAPSFLRAFAVEFRKLIDTRSGAALLGIAALLAGVFGGGAALTADARTDFGRIALMAGVPGGLILMVLAILLVTSEFTTRTASVTFTLNPRRSEVLAAKVAVVLVMALLVTALSVVAGALVMVVSPSVTGQNLPWTVNTARLAVFTATSALMACSGIALGLAFRNTPAPLVILLTWPMVASMVATASPAAAEALSYLDQAAAAGLAGGATGPAVVKVMTSFTVWVLVPGVIGTLRTLRGDLS